MPVSGRRRVALLAAAGVVVVAAGVALCLATIDPAAAQSAPFGVPRPSAPAGPRETGITGWLLTQQAQFYRSLSGLVRAAKADGSAVWGLLGVSFLYGVFHAAGPGHGKAVISSYLIANEETWRRGVVLSFASAFLQAVVAIALVGVAAAALNVTAKTMNETVRWIEIVSYALIALVGARLVWTKGRAFVAALRTQWRTGPALAMPALATAGAHAHHHHDHDHDHGHHHHGHGAHHHGEEPCPTCGHAHGPDPKDLAGPGGWTRGLAAIVAVGLRPCSGAVLILVFALAQGLFWAGVASAFVMGLGTAITVAVIATLAVGAKALAVRFAAADTRRGDLILRGVEVMAAGVVLVFGLALLTGYMVSERMI